MGVLGEIQSFDASGFGGISRASRFGRLTLESFLSWLRCGCENDQPFSKNGAGGLELMLRKETTKESVKR